MKNKFGKLFAAIGALAFVLSAHATPIQVAYSPVTTQPSSNGLPQLTTWVDASIVTFNADHFAGYPLPDRDAFAFDVTPGSPNPIGPTFVASTTYSITLDLTGYQYIVLAWGNSTIPDDKGTADYLYYVNGTGLWTFFDSHAGATGDGTAALAGGGLSGITVWGGSSSVPDGGTTALMLGLGLVALALVGYRRQAVKA